MKVWIFVCLVLAFFPLIDGQQKSAALRTAFATARRVDAEITASNRLLLEKGVDKSRDVFFFRHQVTNTARDIGKIGNQLINLMSQFSAKNQSLLQTLASLNTSLDCPYKNLKCNDSEKFRTIDGKCNNLRNPLFGKANVPFTRLLPPNYDDGFSTPRTKSFKRGSLPSARLVSTTVLTASDSSTRTRRLNLFGVFFGQFLAHDFERFAVQPGEGMAQLNCCASRDLGIVRPQRPCFPIDVPSDDPFFSRFNRTCLNFVRSLPAPQLNCTVGPRQQLTQVTGFIDASNVYGSSEEEINFLRMNESGLMRLVECSPDTLPPPDVNNESECSREKNPMRFKCFKAGDVRVNENPGLAVHHIIWLREHNRIARSLTQINPHWDDERLFQESRRIVIAEMQNIVFGEFLPIIIGNFASRIFRLTPQKTNFFTGYDDEINATPRNGFSVAAFRFGHSMLADKIPFVGGCFDLDYQCTPDQVRERSKSKTTGNLRDEEKQSRVCPNNRLSILLRKVFERPDTFFQRITGVDAITRGLILAKAQNVDNKLSEEVTNHLFAFGKRGSGMDLAALNIQRGRDHGIPAYNEWRKFCGLPRLVRWGTGKGGLVNHNLKVAKLLKQVYSHPNDIDLFAGGISELPYYDSLMGPTFTCILGKQFFDFKFGDRFWFENRSPNPFTQAQLNSIRKIKYSRIVSDNTGLFRIFSDVFRPITYYNLSRKFLIRHKLPGLNLQLWKESP